MANDIPDLGLVPMELPPPHSFIVQGGGTPLARVLREDLDAVHTEASRLDQGVVQSTGNGEMATEHSFAILDFRFTNFDFQELR